MKSFAGIAVWSAVVAAATVLVLHYAVLPRLPVHGSEVPPLIGLSPEQARGLLEPRGLLLVLEGEREAAVQAGLIAEQRPLGGSRLHRGDQVHAYLARASAPPKVPQLAGMTSEAAREALAKVRLQVGTVTQAPSETLANGLVISSRPPAGAEAKPESGVDLTVSSGPAAEAVPSVIGKSLRTAKQMLEKAGFAVGGTRYGSNDDFDQGVVIRQNPAAGAQASRGVKIDLVIND